MVTAKSTRLKGVDRFARDFEAIASNVDSVIKGKAETVRLALVGLMAEGHLLIEDVPGVGKTMLAKALARSTSCEWRRIQFTPDLLPSDVTGVSVYDASEGRFVFNPGPVFANIVLGDEINRASGKTQSSLLESMEERQTTVDGETYPLPRPFMVVATQNPLEHEGTYPLPESQLDRFMMRLSLGYPDKKSSVDILDSHGASEPIEEVAAVASVKDVISLIDTARSVYVADGPKGYIVDIAEATRTHRGVELGASPRATLYLLRAARARAASEGRDFVTPEDVKRLVLPILSHRMVLSAESQMVGATAEDVLTEVLESVDAPSLKMR